jgi:hypothetical protein
MRHSFRAGFYGGLTVALLIAFFLTWLWRPEHQVSRHSENLLRAMQHKDWRRMADFVASDYKDQWGGDRALLLARTREVFQYLRNIRITASNPSVRFDDGTAHWQSKILVGGAGDEMMTVLKERLNSLTTPFDLEWRRISWRPWDWKLMSVSNAELTIPEYAE